MLKRRLEKKKHVVAYLRGRLGGGVAGENTIHVLRNAACNVIYALLSATTPALDSILLLLSSRLRGCSRAVSKDVERGGGQWLLPGGVVQYSTLPMPA